MNIIKPPTEEDIKKSKLCLECLECCKRVSLSIEIEGPMYLYEEWAAVRNIKIITIEDNKIWMAVPYPCPHLTDKGCKIYKVRPVICRIYDATEDPAARDKCKWKELK